MTHQIMPKVSCQLCHKLQQKAASATHQTNVIKEEEQNEKKQQEQEQHKTKITRATMKTKYRNKEAVCVISEITTKRKIATNLTMQTY